MNPPMSTRDHSDEFQLGHRRWLDGLRGIAILLVLAYHLHLLGSGFLGVDLFFVLSGFLITSLLLEEHRRTETICFIAFYRRRALRILPALLLMLAGVLTWAALKSPQQLKDSRREAVVVICFGTNMQDRLHHVPMGMLGFTWSLAVEEQFYFIWPALLFVLLRCRVPRTTIMILMGVGIVAIAIFRSWVFANLPPPTDMWWPLKLLRTYTGPDTRGDSILCGCLAATLAYWGYYPRTVTQRQRIQSAGMVSLGLLLGVFYAGTNIGDPYMYYGAFTGFGLLTATLIFSMISAPEPILRRILEFGPLVGVGRISYGLFLYHFPIIAMMGIDFKNLGWSWPGNTAIVVVVSFVVSIISYYCLEQPMLRLKKWFEPARTASQATEKAPTPMRRAA